MSIPRKSRLTKRAGTAATITAAGAMAIGLVTNWEGIRLAAYQDVIGVWTVCQGVTKGVRRGMVFTREQCDVLFMGELAKHEAGLRQCLKDPDSIPVEAYVSFVSWTYNVGVGAACRSTLVRVANSGNIMAACDQLPRWNRAGGRVVRGLTNRRQAERQLCLSGLT